MTNREIKFRALTRENKIIHNVGKIEFFTDGTIIVNDEIPVKKLIEFTGLKDSAGKEVYEGDIVKCSSGCPHEVIFVQEMGGKYFGGMPGFNLSGMKIDGGEGYAWTGIEEIIGNIYENPELLKN